MAKAAKAAASGPQAEKKAEPRQRVAKAGPETRTVTYLAPGQVVDTTRPAASLDPKLEEIREQERKALDAIKVEPRPGPTIDDELVKARDAQVKRETERAKNSK